MSEAGVAWFIVVAGSNAPASVTDVQQYVNEKKAITGLYVLNKGSIGIKAGEAVTKADLVGLSATTTYTVLVAGKDVQTM